MNPEAPFAAAWSLRDLLDPFGEDAFFGDVYERAPLHAPGSNPRRFESLISLDEVDRVVTGADLPAARVALARGGQTLDPAAFESENGALDVPRLLTLHADGATLIVNAVEDRLPALADLCAALELAFGALVQANLYITPANAAGFATHFDTHDVFVLQVSGRKLWRLYRGPIELPLPAQACVLDAAEMGDALDEIELAAGDVLYLPRGFVHEAETADQPSAHLTLGLHAYTWTDLVYEVLAKAALDDPAFRAALPRAYAGGEFDRAEARRMLGKLVARLAARGDGDAAFNAVRADFHAARRPRLRGQLNQLAALERLTIDSLATSRPHLGVQLCDEEQAIVIACHGKQIRVPRLGAEAVRFAFSERRFRVRDLPGGLDDESRLALVRRLAREGLLVIET